MKLKHYCTAAGAFLIAAALIAFPQETVAAAGQGLNLWWTVVFPALLPFFIVAEILKGLGAVHFLGVLLEPLMQPLFRVPGVGGFVLAVSMASGYPVGAMLAAECRQQKAISREEGERLLAFASTAGPLFMTGAVATSMLGWSAIGGTLVLAHYLSCLSTGLVLRYYKPGGATTASGPCGFPLPRAAKALVAARQQDGRSLGTLFSEAIAKGFTSIFQVGGFIISFAVLIGLVNASGLIRGLAALTASAPGTLSLICTGFLELTNGCRLAAQAAMPITAKLIIISAIIAWGGLSVHGQAASFAGKTDLSLKPYLLARIIQSGFAALYAAIILRLGWHPPLPAAAITFLGRGLGVRYLASFLGAVALFPILAAVGLLFSFLLAPGVKVSQPRS